MLIKCGIKFQYRKIKKKDGKNEKIIKILISFLMISTVAAVDSSNWGTVTVRGETFKIPPELEGGKYLSCSYNKGSYSIIGLDSSMLYSHYGFIIKKAKNTEDLTIKGHPAQHITYGQGYSRVYFAVGDSIYAINWKGTNITPEIEGIIGSSTPSSISSGSFYNILAQANADYKQSQKNYYVDLDADDEI